VDANVAADDDNDDSGGGGGEGGKGQENESANNESAVISATRARSAGTTSATSMTAGGNIAQLQSTENYLRQSFKNASRRVTTNSKKSPSSSAAETHQVADQVADVYETRGIGNILGNADDASNAVSNMIKNNELHSQAYAMNASKNSTWRKLSGGRDAIGEYDDEETHQKELEEVVSKMASREIASPLANEKIHVPKMDGATQEYEQRLVERLAASKRENLAKGSTVMAPSNSSQPTGEISPGRFEQKMKEKIIKKKEKNANGIASTHVSSTAACQFLQEDEEAAVYNKNFKEQLVQQRSLPVAALAEGRAQDFRPRKAIDDSTGKEKKPCRDAVEKVQKNVDLDDALDDDNGEVAAEAANEDNNPCSPSSNVELVKNDSSRKKKNQEEKELNYVGNVMALLHAQDIDAIKEEQLGVAVDLCGAMEDELVGKDDAMAAAAAVGEDEAAVTALRQDQSTKEALSKILTEDTVVMDEEEQQPEAAVEVATESSPAQSLKEFVDDNQQKKTKETHVDKKKNQPSAKPKTQKDVGGIIVDLPDQSKGCCCGCVIS